MAGLIQKGLVQPDQIIGADIRAERVAELHTRYGISPANTNRAAAEAADVVVVAVKPQYFESVAEGMQHSVKADGLVISILAGTTLESLVSGIGHPAVVRAMPNTPAQIGEGMTMWTATDAVTEAQKEISQTVLTSFGRAVFADKEHYLDMSTAINGSGPGYVFLILEAMIDAGVHLGLTRPVAEELVLQTVIGSARYARESDLHLAQLRNNVTSPGGTTAAGLAMLEEGNLRSTLSEAIWAAYERSVALGDQ